jgi:hypothetical protein
MKDGLSHLVRERKIVQQDAQMLSNRIKYLSQANEKTWKKVEETRRKAEKFSEVKQENEERLYLLQESRIENERALSLKRSNYKQLREKQKRNKSEIRSALLNYKQEEACNLKKIREEELNRLKWDLEIQKEKNLQRKESVFHQKMIGKAKILDFQHKKQKLARNIYIQKIEENEKILNDTEKEVFQMERLEQELIKNLQNTQNIHDRASVDFHKLLNSPGISSLMNSMLKRRKYSNMF